MIVKIFPLANATLQHVDVQEVVKIVGVKIIHDVPHLICLVDSKSALISRVIVGLYDTEEELSFAPETYIASFKSANALYHVFASSVVIEAAKFKYEEKA